MSTQQSHEETVPAGVTKTYVVARQPMKFEDHTRQPGELVPEAADWKVKVRDAYLSIGWMEEITLVSDADRQAIHAQLQREQAIHAQEAAKRQEAEAKAQQAHPQPEPLPEGAVTLKCANCQKPKVFPEPPSFRTIWQCGDCGQRQSAEQSKAGTLQVVAGHVYNHNRAESNWRPHYG